MQVLNAQLIQHRIETRSFRVINSDANTLKFVMTINGLSDADMNDSQLELSLALYRIDDFGHAQFCSAYNWFGGKGVPPSVEWDGAARRVFGVIDPSRGVAVGADISAQS